MRAMRDELTFALTAEETEAHRQVPIHPDNWHHLGCQVTPSGDVFVFSVGTVRCCFGVLLLVSSRALWAGCRSFWLDVPLRHGTCWLLMTTCWSAEVLRIVAGCCLLRSLRFSWSALSWHKTCAGDALVEPLLRSRCIGISSRRAEWFTRWTEKMASSATVHVASFEEGLGRIMFVAGALEHERPFLGSTRQVQQHASEGFHRLYH